MADVDLRDALVYASRYPDVAPTVRAALTEITRLELALESLGKELSRLVEERDRLQAIVFEGTLR